MKEITSKRTKQTQFITDEEWDWLKEQAMDRRGER